MCGYMLGHYHIHLRVRELAVTPSPINHMALRDNLFLSLILCEPHKAKAFRVARLCFSFHLRRGGGSKWVEWSPFMMLAKHNFLMLKYLIPEPWWLLQMCWSSLWGPAQLFSREDPERSGQMSSCPLSSFSQQRMHQFLPFSFCCLTIDQKGRNSLYKTKTVREKNSIYFWWTKYKC